MQVKSDLDLIDPMMPILVKDITEGADYVYQVKWDGVRMLAYLSSGKVTLFNKRGNLRTEQYPELQELTALLRIPAVSYTHLFARIFLTHLLYPLWVCLSVVYRDS